MPEKASLLLEKGLQVGFSDKVRKLIDENCSFINFPKDTIVLLQGDISYSLYFVLRGVVRGYYIDENGRDITKCFASENELFSTEGLRAGSPSTLNIECLEDCRCLQLPYNFLNKAMKEYEELYIIFDRYALKAMEDIENRARDLVMKSAEDRYLEFMLRFKGLNKRIHQKYIASYIGIRESSLSRIRKTIKSEAN